MPIRPENRDRYPDDWAQISKRIRGERAQWMCECRGQCGHDHTHDDTEIAWQAWLTDLDVAETQAGRCPAVHNWPNPVTGSNVVLTTAHLNHTPEDCRDENLLALCQRCHLSYDRERHMTNRIRNRTRQLEDQMEPMFTIKDEGVSS